MSVAPVHMSWIDGMCGVGAWLHAADKESFTAFGAAEIELTNIAPATMPIRDLGTRSFGWVYFGVGDTYEQTGLMGEGLLCCVRSEA